MLGVMQQTIMVRTAHTVSTPLTLTWVLARLWDSLRSLSIWECAATLSAGLASAAVPLLFTSGADTWSEGVCSSW